MGSTLSGSVTWLPPPSDGAGTRLWHHGRSQSHSAPAAQARHRSPDLGRRVQTFAWGFGNGVELHRQSSRDFQNRPGLPVRHRGMGNVFIERLRRSVKYERSTLLGTPRCQPCTRDLGNGLTAITTGTPIKKNRQADVSLTTPAPFLFTRSAATSNKDP
jgi:hypothetical protein